MIQITEIDAEDWMVVPIQAPLQTIVTIEIATPYLIDFGVVKDLQQWEETEEDDFDREFWQEEFKGSHEIKLALKASKKGYSLIFWNSNYRSRKVPVAYRISYGPPNLG
jgi:hypothetical protein